MCKQMSIREKKRKKPEGKLGEKRRKNYKRGIKQIGTRMVGKIYHKHFKLGNGRLSRYMEYYGNVQKRRKVKNG